MPTIEYLRDKAAWSDFTTRNVDPNAPTNLATRARNARAMADQDALAAAEVEAQHNATQALIRRDKTAQALYLGQQRIAETKRMHDETMRINQDKANMEAELFPLKRDALAAQTKAAGSLELARTQAAKFKADMDKQQHDDTAGFTSFILGSGARRGTPAFAEAVAQARIKYPAVPTALFDDTWKMTGSTRTPEEVQASIAAARSANPNAVITATEKATTVTDKPEAQARVNPELQTLKSRLGAAEANQATAEPSEQPKYEPGLKALRDKIASLEAPSATKTNRPPLNDIFK
jgi:hypothetical protein